MQVSVAATNDSAQGPAASSLLDAGAPGFATGSTCDIGPDRPVHDAGVGANSREADGLRGKLNGAGASADSREAGGLRGMKHRACTRADDRGAEGRGG
jgi:hypothetical protein